MTELPVRPYRITVMRGQSARTTVMRDRQNGITVTQIGRARITVMRGRLARTTVMRTHQPSTTVMRARPQGESP